MLGEMAGTLGRAGERIERALADVEVLGDEVDALTEAHRIDGPARELLHDKIVSFNLAVERAEARVWELIVQREALGMRRHETIPRVYPIPPRRRLP
jgi:hypothetical protein